jgi:hypothetical protein
MQAKCKSVSHYVTRNNLELQPPHRALAPCSSITSPFVLHSTLALGILQGLERRPYEGLRRLLQNVAVRPCRRLLLFIHNFFSLRTSTLYHPCKPSGSIMTLGNQTSPVISTIRLLARTVSHSRPKPGGSSTFTPAHRTLLSQAS